MSGKKYEIKAKGQSHEPGQAIISNTQVKTKSVLSDVEAERILRDIERLIKENQISEGVNMLKTLKQNINNLRNVNLCLVILINLGVLYYQGNFLEYASIELCSAASILRDSASKLMISRTKDTQRLKYETQLGRVELQMCILYSEMGKHEQALEHAKASCKVNYNLVYDLLVVMYGCWNKREKIGERKREGYDSWREGYEGRNDDEEMDIENSIAVLLHLLAVTKDLKLAFLQKDKAVLLDEQMQMAKKLGKELCKLNIDQLYEELNSSNSWIYKSKILDEIQLEALKLNHFDDVPFEPRQNEVIEKITALAVSLYCFSTETRFLEKLKNNDSNDVLDSEHWLSRSLEIAYMFMPTDAPILNQILTVHDRFHGLDKQTIPEDEEVTGFFKVLKPLSKPKSYYSSKTPICSPVMIRIQPEKLEIEIEHCREHSKESSTSKQEAQSERDNKRNRTSVERIGKIKGTGIVAGIKKIEFMHILNPLPKMSERCMMETMNVKMNRRLPAKLKRKDKRGNISELHGKAIISEDLLQRPYSDEKEPVQLEELQINSERRKRSLPGKRRERTVFLGTNFMFEGLRLQGRRIDDGLDTENLDKFRNDKKVDEHVYLQNKTGNVYINNNINLFISNSRESPIQQTFIRGHVKTDKDISRRQAYLNRRKPNNFVFSPEDI